MALYVLSLSMCLSQPDLSHVLNRTFFLKEKIHALFFFCMLMPFTNHRSQGTVAPTVAPSPVPWFIWVVDSLSVRGRHTGDGETQQRDSAPVDWSLRPFVLTVFFTRCVKSYKGFLLHTLLANCIKAFGDCCLSPCVCTSIKRRELQHVETCARYHLSSREGCKNAETRRVWRWHLFVSPFLWQIQPDRTFINSASLFPLTVIK